MVNTGNEGLLFPTNNGKVTIEAADTPSAGDEILINPQSDGSFITHGTSVAPQIGDEGLLVQTDEGPVYIAGGAICDPDNTNYWKWYEAGIDTEPWEGKQIEYIEMLWSSKEFRAIKFDIYFIGHCKITAFGQVVLDMLSPTDDEGWAVEYHLEATYESDNPCGQRAVRLLSEPAGIMQYGYLRGTVEILVGPNGTINPGVEVITP